MFAINELVTNRQGKLGRVIFSGKNYSIVFFKPNIYKSYEDNQLTRTYISYRPKNTNGVIL